VRNDRDESLAWRDTFRGRANFSNHNVQILENSVGFLTERAGFVLDMVERAQVQGQQRGMLGLENPFHVAATRGVAFCGSIQTAAIFAEGFRCLFEQTGGGYNSKKLGIVRRASAPEFRNVPGNMRANGDGPLHACGGAARSGSGVPESWHTNVLGIPIP